MVKEKVEKFYNLLGYKEKKDIRIFQRYFPNNYNLNELTNDMVEDFCLIIRLLMKLCC